MGTVAPEMAGLMKPRLTPKELCCLAPGYASIRQKNILAPFLQIPNMRPLLLPPSLQLLGTDLGTPNEHHPLSSIFSRALRGPIKPNFQLSSELALGGFSRVGEPGSGKGSAFQPLALLCRARAESPCSREPVCSLEFTGITMCGMPQRTQHSAGQQRRELSGLRDPGHITPLLWF